jgi:hypothetical protein
MLKQFLRECLQPILAALGYRNDENTWWVDQGDKVNLIHLQIFPWSTSQKLDFCICKGTASKGKLKYAQGDMRNPIPLASYLPESRHQRPYRNHMGYSINDKTDFAEFLYEIRNDLELIKGEL